LNSTVGIGLDSLPYQCALLDAGGTIVAVNEAWRRFAEENGANEKVRRGVGLNYLDVCRAARGTDADEAHLAAMTLEAALARGSANASFQYPCHSPLEHRWFLCATSPVTGEHDGVLVAHIHLGGQQSMSMRRGLNGREPQGILDVFPEAAQTMRHDLLLYQHVQQMTSTGGWEWVLPRGELKWTPETFRIHDLVPRVFRPTVESMLQFYGGRARRRLDSALLQAANFGAPFDLELPLVSASGRRLHVRITGRAEIKGVKPVRLYGSLQEITADE
jgi:hypothetical protein